jgi:hypothetical protein
LLALIVLFAGLGTVSAQATGSVSMQWDDLNSTPGTVPDLAGYRAYATTDPNLLAMTPAQASSMGAMTVDLAPGVISHTFNGLNASLLWHFAVTAFDTSGNESVFSAIDSKQPEITPVVQTVSPNNADQGTNGLLVTITGSNFITGSIPDMGPGISIVSVDDSMAPTTLKVTVNVSNLAQLTSFDVTVSNPPSGVSGTKSNAFSVNLNTQRLDIDSSGRIDNADFAQVLLGYPSFSGDALYTTTRDIDVDGDVDGADLSLILSFFGMSP